MVVFLGESILCQEGGGEVCLVGWNSSPEIDGLVCRSPLVYFVSNAEGHLDEAALRLDFKDCNVLSLQQDRANFFVFGASLRVRHCLWSMHTVMSFLFLDKGLSCVVGETDNIL